jgi:hypothetical protein
VHELTYFWKVLYIIPVPLDAATIGDATICCPLVIKRDGDSLICSILPTATTDRGMMCHSDKLVSPLFPEAIRRAEFTISTDPPTATPGMYCHLYLNGVVRKANPNVNAVPKNDLPQEDKSSNSESLHKIIVAKENAVFTTSSATLPSFLDPERTQVISFGTGIEFRLPDEGLPTNTEPSAVVLPCIFGSQLQGPILLATGTIPLNVPFLDETALRDYYKQLKNIVVIVDDGMTDNARNLANSYRI